MTNKKPNSMRHLDDAIRRECGGGQDAYVKARTLMANAVIAQMLPDGVVKGGSALKMRYGNASTRFTTDEKRSSPSIIWGWGDDAILGLVYWDDTFARERN